ncbi:MAG: hypothetical protein N4A63_01405 [Vallitalea sp.]|jgi:hypothetical protein|nr:hypothetical protein [Vallitalea sp.]
MKRVISIVLVLALVISSVSNISAASNINREENNESIKKNEELVMLVDPKDSGTYVIGDDYENGDVEFTQYRENKIVSRYIVKNKERVIEAEYYQEADELIINSELTRELIIRTEIIKLPELTRQAMPSLYGTTSGYLGTIKYDYCDAENSGICGAKVNYVKNTGSIKYDINGKYRDLAGLAGFIAGTLSLSSAPALAVAKSVLSWLGYALGATAIFIPECNLQSDYDEIEYFVENIDSPNNTNSFYGTKHIITEEGNHINEVYKSGDYFAYSPWEDIIFGRTVYSRLFGYLYYNIKSWS